jgi:hypothetical protein
VSRYFKAHKQIKAAKPLERCPLCGEMAALVQDHCHDTGLCRDRICTRCNNLLGRLEWRHGSLEALLDYVRRWSWEHQHGGVPYRLSPGAGMPSALSPAQQIAVSDECGEAKATPINEVSPADVA